MQPNLSFAGMAALGHTNILYGASAGNDFLYEIDSTIGLTGNRVRLNLDGAPFDHSRGDLDSPFCTDDAACDDLNPCTADACAPGGCLHVPVPGCCLTDLDCADQDACTIDRCMENSCRTFLVNTDDGDACTADGCDPTTGPFHLRLVGPDADGNGAPDCLESSPGRRLLVR